MTTPPRVVSNYAIIDVEQGRRALARHLLKKGPVRVTVTGVITDPYGQDDGTSIEFNCLVENVQLEEIK